MGNFSRLGGTDQISPVSSSVWGVQKKRKTEDRKRKDRHNDRPEKVAKKGKDKDNPKDQEDPSQEDLQGETFEDEIGYDSSGSKKKIRRKIDLVI